MIQHPVHTPTDIDDALRIMIKIVVYSYLILAGALALVAGVMIVAMTAAYLLLKLVTNIVAMLLHKHIGFSLRDALNALMQETQRYAREGV